MQKDYLLEFGIRANRLTPEESGKLNEKDLFNYNVTCYKMLLSSANFHRIGIWL